MKFLHNSKNMDYVTWKINPWPEYNCFVALLYCSFSHMKTSAMTSVKPFKSKNRDKIDLDAPNPNLKKGCHRDFLRQPNL